jgi:activating signal cointegrator complex subunit 3
MFNKGIVNNMSIKDILFLMCEAYEFSEVPLRHNEDVLNESLSKLCPY